MNAQIKEDLNTIINILPAVPLYVLMDKTKLGKGWLASNAVVTAQTSTFEFPYVSFA